MSMRRIARSRSFDGWVETYEHRSVACAGTMRFAVYLPPAAELGEVPALYWLSGLTCTEENFMVKAGGQRVAAELGIALVAPDTSPRDADIEGEDDDWDFGTGAGFYVDATAEPWSAHYRMYSYVVEELPALVESELPIAADRRAVSGHSMGGHGALVVGLRNPDRYRSISAFSPICAPSRCPWGQKALGRYLANDSEWAQYDACELMRSVPPKRQLIVEQGADDPFLEEQLKPKLLRAAAEASGHQLDLRVRPGYDHSYYFVSTFIADHLRHHASALGES